MKHIILYFVFFTALFTCFSSFAQVEQGTFVINERFDFSTTTTKSNGTNPLVEFKETRFSSTTSFGYLLKENQEVGISLVFGNEKISSQNSGVGSDGTINRQNYGFGIYYKRYVTIVDKLSFFVTPQLNYLSSEDGNTVNKNSIGASVYTGLLYRPTKRFGLSINLVGAGLNYTYQNQTVLKQNSFSLSNVGGLNLGLQFMF